MRHIGYVLQPISEMMELIQGQVPYGPTRLEWLEVKLNAVLGCYSTMILEGFLIFF